MRRFAKIVSMGLCAVLLAGASLAFTACKPKEVTTSGTLSIKYYQGGYGRAWIDDFAERFTEETGYPVRIEPSESVATTAESEMADGNAYDIYISHGMPVFKMAARDLLADLTDVYASTVDGVTFEERVIPAAREMAMCNVKGTEKYVMVPYTQGVGGLVYNKTMFEENGWDVPKTYEELEALCEDIIADTNGEVTPFVWGNEISYMWDYVVCDWWAQLAGIDEVNEFFSYPDAEVYNPNTEYTEFAQAFKLWTDLVAKNSNYSYGGTGLSKVTALASFKNGRAAMFPNAHWLFNEMVDLNPQFDMEFMNTPLAPNAVLTEENTDEDGKYNYNYLVGFGDAFAVPKCAVNLDIAKEFLKFVARKENCARFTELTNGTFLAFDYNGVEINYNNVSEQAKVFIDSVKSKIDGSIGYNVTSKAAISYMNTLKLGNWTDNKYYYTTAYEKQSNGGGLSDADVNGYLTANYNFAKTNWANFERKAGIA